MWSTLLGLGAYMIAPKIIGKMREQKIQVVHAIPGRLRLQNVRWKDQQAAAYMENVLKQHPLIGACQVSPITGSMLLEFTNPYLQQSELDEILQLVTDVTVESFSVINDKLMNTMKGTFDRINGNVKKTTNGYTSVDSLLIVYFLFQGLRSFPANPAFASSLFYWAYTLLKNSGEMGGDSD
ncbi:hypothetical protein J2S09_000297 [Bacillus fengqiuensis]|nr:hypothetical protein [Bacillus fengqiuensis]